MQKDFHQEDGHSSDLDQKRSGILLLSVNHKENGQSCRADDFYIRRKQTPSLQIHKSIVSRSAQEQKVVENYQYTSALLRERLKLFFAQLFQLISSVFTEQSQICVTNAKPAM